MHPRRSLDHAVGEDVRDDPAVAAFVIAGAGHEHFNLAEPLEHACDLCDREAVIVHACVEFETERHVDESLATRAQDAVDVLDRRPVLLDVLEYRRAPDAIEGFRFDRRRGDVVDQVGSVTGVDVCGEDVRCAELAQANAGGGVAVLPADVQNPPACGDSAFVLLADSGARVERIAEFTVDVGDARHEPRLAPDQPHLTARACQGCNRVGDRPSDTHSPRPRPLEDDGKRLGRCWKAIGTVRR